MLTNIFHELALYGKFEKVANLWPSSIAEIGHVPGRISRVDWTRGPPSLPEDLYINTDQMPVGLTKEFVRFGKYIDKSICRGCWLGVEQMKTVKFA